MLAMFMGAIEATIVSTAMPAIVADLGGFTLYSWVFSAYLLMNSITVLIYGKLSDLFGRKPILFFGIILFLIGSILCGFASSMQMLIVFRLIQGFGAGAVTPIATTIVGDIYTAEERAKIQGYLSSVWGISAITGPAIGGLLVQYVSWHYVFWINIPLGILSLAGLWFFLHENIEKKKHEIDYIGAILLTVSISSLMFVLVEGGSWTWNSWQCLSLLSLAALSFIAFVFQEGRATEPVMPFSIWKDRSIFIANVTSLYNGNHVDWYFKLFTNICSRRNGTDANHRGVHINRYVDWMADCIHTFGTDAESYWLSKHIHYRGSLFNFGKYLFCHDVSCFGTCMGSQWFLFRRDWDGINLNSVHCLHTKHCKLAAAWNRYCFQYVYAKSRKHDRGSLARRDFK